MAETYEKRSISVDTANQMVLAAMQKARELSVPMVIAICDESGILKAFVRMDGAPLLSVRVAQQKAWASVSFGMPTHRYYEFIKEDPPLLTGLPHQQDFVVFGGGYPIKLGGHLVGAIGASGGHYSHDQEAAKAALLAVGATID